MDKIRDTLTLLLIGGAILAVVVGVLIPWLS